MKFQCEISGSGYGYVYVMSYPNSQKYKIGHALNPTTRAADIGGTLAPETPILEAYFWCSERREDVERNAHEQLKKYRSNGEWFCVSIEDAVRAIEKAANNVSVKIKRAFMKEGAPLLKTMEQRQAWLQKRLESRSAISSSGNKEYGYDANYLKGKK